jgi:hypothetical protein
VKTDFCRRKESATFTIGAPFDALDRSIYSVFLYAKARPTLDKITRTNNIASTDNIAENVLPLLRIYLAVNLLRKNVAQVSRQFDSSFLQIIRAKVRSRRFVHEGWRERGSRMTTSYSARNYPNRKFDR